MTYWSLETLNQDMEKMEGSIEGRLYLSGYVTLEPVNTEAEDYLGLQKEGYLPPTVSWLSDEGMKIRIYLAPEGVFPIDVHCDGMALEVHTGGGDCVLVKSSQVRRRYYQACKDASFLIKDPTKLPAVTFEFLRLLALIKKRSNDMQPAIAQS